MGYGKNVINNIDCDQEPRILCEQMRRALEILEERIDHLVNEEGIFAGNLPQGVKIPRCNGEDVDISQIANSFSVLENTQGGVWTLASTRQTFPDPPHAQALVDPEGWSISPNGSIAAALQDGGGNATVWKYTAIDYQIGQPAGTFTTRVEMDTPHDIMVWTDDSKYLLAYGNAAKTLCSFDMSGTSPVFVDSLVMTANFQLPPSDMQWSPTRRLLWMCDASIFDRVVGVAVDASGNLTLAEEYIDAVNLNRANAIAISPDENFLYVASIGRICTINVTTLGAVTTEDTYFTPGGGTEKVYNIVTGVGFGGCTSTLTTPFTVYSLTIAGDQKSLTATGTTQASVGDNSGRNLRSKLNGSEFSVVTSPSDPGSTILAYDMINLSAPVESQVAPTNQGNAGSRYHSANAQHWSIFNRPQTIDCFVYSWAASAGGITWGDPTDPDQCANFNSVKAGFMEFTAPDGIPPMSVISTTKVDNLNVDRVDDLHAAEIVAQSVSETTDEWLFWERLNV